MTRSVEPRSAGPVLPDDVTRLGARVARVLWPVRCAGCGRPDVVLCPGCAGWAGSPRRFDLPGVPVPVWGVAAYGGTAKQLLARWKEHGRHDLTAPLSAGLAAAVVAALAPLPPGPAAALVPVPTSAAGRRRRGVELVTELAVRAVARPEFVVPPARAQVLPGLRVRRRVRDQAGLDLAGRRANLAGAFEVRRGWREAVVGRRCVVVDDVVTTGATLGEAVRTLEAAGTQVVAACCLCVTFRRRGVPIRARLD